MANKKHKIGQRQKKQTLSSETLQELDEFLARVNHEVRNPLNGVLGLAEILEDQVFGSLNDKQMELVSGIRDSGSLLQETFADIVDIARISAGLIHCKPSLVNISGVCESVLEKVKEKAGKQDLDLKFLREESLPGIRADEKRLERLLVILLSIAVKSAPPGEVSVLKTRQNGDCLEFLIGTHGEKDGILLESMVVLEESLSNTPEGMGLGLSLSQMLVEMHGGSLSLSSATGRGNSFLVKMPIHTPV